MIKITKPWVSDTWKVHIVDLQSYCGRIGLLSLLLAPSLGPVVGHYTGSTWGWVVAFTFALSALWTVIAHETVEFSPRHSSNRVSLIWFSPILLMVALIYMLPICIFNAVVWTLSPPLKFLSQITPKGRRKSRELAVLKEITKKEDMILQEYNRASGELSVWKKKAEAGIEEVKPIIDREVEEGSLAELNKEHAKFLRDELVKQRDSIKAKLKELESVWKDASATIQKARAEYDHHISMSKIGTTSELVSVLKAQAPFMDALVKEFKVNTDNALTSIRTHHEEAKADRKAHAAAMKEFDAWSADSSGTKNDEQQHIETR